MMDDLDFYHSVQMKPPIYTTDPGPDTSLFWPFLLMPRPVVEEIHDVDADGNPRTSWQYSIYAPCGSFAAAECIGALSKWARDGGKHDTVFYRYRIYR